MAVDQAPVAIRYDESTGTLSVETAGPTIMVENLGNSATFVRVGDDDIERDALFVSSGEADVLLKMVTYILEKVRVTPESQAALESLKPRLEALRDH